MTDKERHEGCGGLVYSYHKDKEWYIFCRKCGKKTGVYDTYQKARKAWEEENHDYIKDDR